MARRSLASLALLGFLLALAAPAAADGSWDRAWGKDVIAGNAETGFEVCVVAAQCKEGEASPSGLAGVPLGTPEDAAAASDGNVYVADAAGKRIVVFDASGTFVRMWGKNVVAGNAGTGDEICTVLAQCQTGEHSFGRDGPGFVNPQSVAIDGAGNVYVTDDAAQVQKFDADGHFLRSWGKDVIAGNAETGFEICTVESQCQTGDQGNLGGEFRLLPMVAASPSGAVYVTDVIAERVQQFDTSGNFQRAWGKDVVAGNSDTDAETCTAAAQCQAGVAGHGAGEFDNPWGVATDGTGNVWVAERGPGGGAFGSDARVQRFGPTGGFQLALGKDVDGGDPGTGFEVCTNPPDCQAGQAGTTGGAFDTIYDVAVDGDANLYVLDSNNHRIQKFGPSGDFIRTWGKGVAGGAGFETCATVDGCQAGALGGKGGELSDNTAQLGANPVNGHTVYTAEYNGYRVQAFSDADVIDTTITSGPAGGTNDKTPTFTFTADPPGGATFECAIDGAVFATCGTPYMTAPLPEGPHRLRVRATSPGSGTDTSPATRDFTVDTVAPSTVITLVPQGGDSRKISDTAFSGTVRATADEQDPPPGVGNGVTRCVLDPPTPPATYEDLPVGACPSPITASLGTHTFYAASLDQAFNVGPVASVTFKMLAAPDTQIVSGPTGTTWLRDPQFTLASTVPGSAFKCRVDGGSFSPCTTPYRTYPLSMGTHTISVVAVSPEGVEDPTPATRTITVANAETHDADCRVAPFPAPQGQSQLGCGWGPKCPARVPCAAALPTCPVAAVCTISLKADFATPNDTFMQVNLGDANHSRFGVFWAQDWIGFARGGGCTLSLLNDNTKACTAFASTKFLGQDRPITTYCAANAYDSLFHAFTAFPGDFGPDDQRTLACGARIKIAAASTLEAVAAGTHPELYAPQPGTLYVVGDISPAGTSSATIARRVKAFRKPLSKRAAKAGPVSFTPKLTRAAARVLDRRHKLVVTLHVRFKPKTGKTITRTRRVTLTRPANPRTLARAKLKAYCRKHRKVRRLGACRRVL